jgi:hypothetical protein
MQDSHEVLARAKANSSYREKNARITQLEQGASGLYDISHNLLVEKGLLVTQVEKPEGKFIKDGSFKILANHDIEWVEKRKAGSVQTWLHSEVRLAMQHNARKSAEARKRATPPRR